MSARRRKKPHRKVVITAVISALIILILIVTGLLLFTQKPAQSPGKIREQTTVTITRPLIVGEEILIKGCLFDLGIPRDSISVKGRTIHVTTEKIPPSSRIRKAFTDIEGEEGVKVSMDEPSRISIIMNGHTWDIIFSAAAGRRVDVHARVAIIIDDMGQDMGIARKLAAIDADLTFAVLPHEPYTADVARYLHSRGRQVLLHLPMEGNGKNPGQGAIYGTTDPAEAAEILRDSLELVPDAVGVNNHMGSVVTRDKAIMEALITVLKEQDLFFIDSLTTGGSVCRSVAEEVGLPFMARDVFLDNEQSTEYITGQIEKLIETALRHGEAIGICHPHQATYKTLAREVPRLRDIGIEVVKVSTLVDSRD
ncbi:MAG TPA: divergent polysaccharide deacetylase family protein [Deltaproteobacteria bacterium]|nr:divergent polysaccharide deacetylase family protein [Deltaproteobacteria bacterium]HPR55696.1 divergent polysaccharide deacetylase family protein [Deltaproteobacteria bacterium]